MNSLLRISLLANRAPGGGAASNFGAFQGGAATRTISFAAPTFVEEPSLRRVCIGGGNFFDGFAADPAGLFPESADFLGREGFDAAFWIESGAPEDFVGHPVADASERFLHQERGFDG